MWRVYPAKETLIMILRHGTSYITKHTKIMIIHQIHKKILHIIKTETPSTAKKGGIIPNCVTNEKFSSRI